MARGDNKRILSELDVKLIHASELPASSLARILGVSERRIHQIRPARQRQNHRNDRGGRGPTCRTCEGAIDSFLTSGNGELLEVCVRGHRIVAPRVEGEEVALTDSEHVCPQA
jgi:hypothetical protein